MVPRTFTRLLLGAVLVSIPLSSADAQPAAAQTGSLAAQAREAAANFQAPSPQQADAAKTELAAALSQLDGFLRTGAPHKAAGWKRYLQWNDLVGLLQQDQPPAELISSLQSKFRAAHGGLELPPFTRVRDALTKYAANSRRQDAGSLREEYGKRMEELATQLETYGREPGSSDAALAIGRTLGWLDENGLASDLVASIRQTYGRPNLYGHASQRFIAAGIEDDVDRVSGVRDNILGTDIYGTARLTGRTTLVLNENDRMASMNILLGGRAVSNNVGYNGPVTIYSTGITSVSAQKPIVMTANGLAGYAAGAACGTSTNIYDICARCGLIERVAWRRAGQQKAEAEAIASRHAEWRVAGQMNGEAGRLIAEQNARYNESFRDPLIRRGAFPEELIFSSRSDRAEVRMRQEAAGLLGAPGEPPDIDEARDLSIRAHESVVTNFGQGVLGGFELTDLRLEKLIRDELKADLPDELRVTLPDGTLDPEKEPWSIIFSKDVPVRAKFRDGGLWIGIRADGFTRGEGDTPGKYRPAITELLEIAAAYKIEKTDKGATLRRDGDVQVRFPNRANPEQITVRDSPTVTFIRRKFRSLFKEEFIGEGLVFKGRWERAGRLTLQDIKSENAWLTLGWQMPSGGGASEPAVGAE